MTLQHLSGSTYHRRRGETKNAFKYGVDYVLTDLTDQQSGPILFSRNRTNLMSVFVRDYGGTRGAGEGVSWVHSVLEEKGVSNNDEWRVLLLAQPRMLGTKFSPVSFWLIVDRDQCLRAVIAEVNNTFGERHSYFCALPNLQAIKKSDTIEAEKIFHVSPFQPVEGAYRFNFDYAHGAIKVRIDYRHAQGGVLATLETSRRKLTNTSIVGAVIRRPFGSLRVLSLIHFQALKLWLSGAVFKRKPEPPRTAVS